MEVVEEVEGIGCHNMLRCSSTGVIVDFSLGQFTGSMSPRVYGSMEEFLSFIPGMVLEHRKTPSEDIQSQLARDRRPLVAMISPDALPEKFAQRVVKAYQNQNVYCSNCFGIASSGSTLFRCSRCRRNMYCSKVCQKLHWSEHKSECSSSSPSSPSVAA